MADERDIEHEKPEADVAEERSVGDEDEEEDRELDPEAPEADAAEQRRSARPNPGREAPDLDQEANEADLIEQSESVPGDDQDEWE